jgi:DNA-binding Lrp family transcriptional regulator
LKSDAIAFERKLCGILQEGLPICARPFAEIAKALDIDEDEVLREIYKLKALGLIRRICAVVNYRVLGFVSTLVAAHITVEDLRQVVPAVNALPGVSHNYLRDHHYNLWFTLQAKSFKEIESAISDLCARFGIDFHSLPIRRVFKLNVRFDAGNECRGSDSGMKQIPMTKIVCLNDIQKRVLEKLQDDLELVGRPFAFLCGEDLSENDVLATIKELVDKGVIRRIAGIVNHHKLGFGANVLFVCEVPRGKVHRAGESLARFTIVSHCYERETFEGWPYNLFAMMHARSMDDIRQSIDEFARNEEVGSFQVLPTVVELKKQPVKYNFV